MDFFVSKTPLPPLTMESPAIVILACSRKDSIMNTIQNVTSLAGVEKYKLYLSLGCVERISKEVYLNVLHYPIDDGEAKDKISSHQPLHHSRIQRQSNHCG